MAPQVYEEVLHLSCSILEPVALTRENAEAFPFVPLKATGAFQEKEFRIFCLENDFLRAEICPELGGRLLSLFDKRDQSHPIVRPTQLVTTPGGPRGVEWRHGLEIVTPKPLNALGPLDHFARDPEDDDESAAVFLFDRDGDVTWHGCWSLPPDQAELSFELRAFNRTMSPADFSASLRGSDEVRVIPEQAEGAMLMGRRTAVFLFRIIPAAGFDSHAIWGRGGLAQLDQGRLRLRPAVRLSKARLLIQGSGASGELVVEAQADLNPEVEVEAAFEGMTSLQSITCDQHVLARAASFVRPTSGAEMAWRRPAPDSAEDLILGAARALEDSPLSDDRSPRYPVPGGEHIAVLLDATWACRDGDFRRADDLLDQYLGLNAEDALAWWLKSVILPRAHPEASENSAAMNAHFLAPLEPVLRVQSFLAQGVGQGREPNPLMRPLAVDQDAAVDAIHLLLVSGLYEEAHQVLNELLRHRPSARLHILSAWLFLRRSRMAFEAATHAQAAAALAPEPPFPRHEFERRALVEVMEAHPLPGLQAWRELHAMTTGQT